MLVKGRARKASENDLIGIVLKYPPIPIAVPIIEVIKAAKSTVSIGLGLTELGSKLHS